MGGEKKKGLGKPDTRNIICKLMVHKHKNICVDIYWNNVTVAG
jgi:hypothetical protein